MNLIDIAGGVKSLFLPPKRKEADLMNPGFLTGMSRGNQWLELYNENPRLSVVHKISSDNGATPYSITSTTRKSTFYVKNHPFEAEIKKHSVPQIFSLWTAYYLMQGVVYIAFDLDEVGNPTDFKVFTKVHKLVGGDGKEYEFRYGNSVKKYPANQVIIDTDLDLNSPYFDGKGKAEAIKDEIETDEFVQKYIKYFYLNSARPDIYITAEKGEEMSEADVNRLESKWYQKFQGINNAHKPVFLNWDANVFSVPTSHKDMELLDTRKFYRDTTIQHFGVPPEIMGIVENSNKATVIAAEHIYAKQVRLPLLEHIELIINTKLLALYRNSEGMKFHFENIIPDDVELTLKVANEGADRMVLTVNEWRVAMGYPKISDEYGNSIVGTIPPAEAVAIEELNLPTRTFKEFQEIVTQDFIERASKTLGKELSNEIVVMREDETEEVKNGKKGTKK